MGTPCASRVTEISNGFNCSLFSNISPMASHKPGLSPSGNLKPSSADLQLTKSFSKAGEILQISVLDHLILSPEGGYYSFKDNGLM